jgi:hypothetical protein
VDSVTQLVQRGDVCRMGGRQGVFNASICGGGVLYRVSRI